MTRRHKVILGLLLLVLGLAAAAIHIATSDLERHRPRIERLLTKKLGQPVQVKQIDFSLLPSPRLECVGLRIGIPEEGRSVAITRLVIAPELLPLLSGRLQLAAIVLEQPRLTVTLFADEKPEKPPAAEAMPELDWLSLDRLTLHGGSLRLIDRRRKEVEQLRLEEIEVTLGDVTTGGIGALKLSATLIQGSQASPLALSGNVRLEEGSWRQTDVEIDFTLNDFAATLLPPLPKGVSAVGRADLALQLKGAAQSGLRISGQLKGRRLNVRTGQFLPVLPVNNVEFEGSLRANEGQLQLTEFRLDSDLLATGGSLTAKRTAAGALLKAKLKHLSLPLPPYPAAASEGPPPPLSLAKGPNKLLLDRLQLAAHLKGWSLPGVETPSPEKNWPAPDSATFSGSGKAISRQESGTGEEQADFNVSGSLSRLFAGEPHLALNVTGTVPAPPLSRLLVPPRQGVGLTGAIAINLALEGPVRTPRFHIGADLTAAGIDGGRLLTKKAGTAARITLDGRKQPDSLILDDARLLELPLDLQLQGTVPMTAGSGYDLTVTLGKSDLKESRPLLPILDKIKLRGTVAGNLKLQQGTEPSGTLTLEDFGMPIKGPLSDLNRFHGEVAIQGRKLHSDRLKGYLGRSPVAVRTGADFSDGFRLTLDVTSDALYASDLVFQDPEAVFRDLSGRVIIEKDAVLLEEVVARLEGGTAVQVEGSISPFKAPNTMLAIAADYGNIDEVIALFKKPEEAPGPAKKAPKKKGGLVLIDIEAKKGKLENLEFEDVEGFLSVENGVLTIHPLTFRSAGGSVAGMVLWDGSKPKPTPLKVSGYLQEVDADTLSRRHLKMEGIVTGGLTGNFYIEGLGTGEQFLKSSQGAFSIEIRKGVLRKFHFLSKIFSILNVSQIFKLKLPDVSGHGMGYKSLKADLQLKDGLLTSNNLYIDSDSMNMSIVGGYNLVSKHLDLTVGVKPLQTVDKIISSIPIAGWLLTGKEKALITTHFEVKGKAGSEKVTAIPFQSVSDQAKGIFKRLFNLPKKLIEDTGRLVTGED